MSQLSNGKLEVFRALAKTEIGPAVLRTPSRTGTGRQVTKPTRRFTIDKKETGNTLH